MAYMMTIPAGERLRVQYFTGVSARRVLLMLPLLTRLMGLLECVLAADVRFLFLPQVLCKNVFR